MEQFLYTSDQLLIKSCLQPEICKNCPLGQGFIQIEKISVFLESQSFAFLNHHCFFLIGRFLAIL